MANTKISDLTAYTTPVSADVVPIVDIANTTTKKVTIANLFNVLSSLFTIKDSTDTTKKVAFDVSGVTTATTRTLTIPNSSGEITALGNTTTGTGSIVLATSPTITGATLTTSSVNGVTLQTGGSATDFLAANGSYVSGSVSNASTTAKGIVELATSSEVTDGTATGGTGAALVVTPDALAASTPVFNGSGLTGITKLLNTVTTDVTYSSSTAENTLLSYSVAGGTLGTGNVIRVTMHITAFGVTNTNNCVIRFKYGATTIASKTYTPTGANASIAGKIEFILAASGATNSQNGSYHINMGNTNYIGATNTQVQMFSETAQGTATEDSTASKTLAITAQHSNSNANDNITVSLITVEVLR